MKKTILLEAGIALSIAVMTAACGDKGKDNGPSGPDGPAVASLITPDGDFTDWDALPKAGVAEFVSENDGETMSSGKVLKAFMDQNYISFYVEYLPTYKDAGTEKDEPLPRFQVFVDADGDGMSGTVSLEYHFIESGIEIMTEGRLVAEGGSDYIPYDPGLIMADTNIESTWQFPTEVTVAAGGGLVSSSTPKKLPNGNLAVEFNIVREMIPFAEWGDEIAVGVVWQNEAWKEQAKLPVGKGGEAVTMLKVPLTLTETE